MVANEKRASRMNSWLKVVLQAYFVAPYVLVAVLLVSPPEKSPPEENDYSTWGNSNDARNEGVLTWSLDEGSIIVSGTMDHVLTYESYYEHYGSSLIVGGSLTVGGTVEAFPYE